MKWLIVLAIELYWKWTDPAHRRPCLFRETCSRHVYRITREAGAVRGMIALAYRLRRCRFGYAVEFDSEGKSFLRLADHSTAQAAELSESMAAFVSQSRLIFLESGFGTSRDSG